MPVGVAFGGATWQPALPLPVVPNLLALVNDEQVEVAFRFTPKVRAMVADVYVDPFRHG